MSENQSSIYQVCRFESDDETILIILILSVKLPLTLRKSLPTQITQKFFETIKVIHDAVQVNILTSSAHTIQNKGFVHHGNIIYKIR